MGRKPYRVRRIEYKISFERVRGYGEFDGFFAYRDIAAGIPSEHAVQSGIRAAYDVSQYRARTAYAHRGGKGHVAVRPVCAVVITLIIHRNYFRSEIVELCGDRGGTFRHYLITALRVGNAVSLAYGNE